MNPMDSSGKIVETLQFCRQHITDFETVGSLLERYIDVSNHFDEQMKSIHPATVSDGTILTIGELNDYLQNVFMEVFRDNERASAGIDAFRKSLLEKYAAEYKLNTRNLNDWMSKNGQESPLNPDFVTLVTTLSAAHYYQVRNQGQQKPQEDVLREGYCPMCGLKPHFGAILEEEGGRVLECWLCGEKWRYNRLECPACHENRQEKLGYFSIEEMPQCRVSFCRSCQHYVKVFDLRKWTLKDPNLWILHLATLMCDDLAVSEGFMPVSGVYWHDKSTVESNRLNIDNN